MHGIQALTTIPDPRHRCGRRAARGYAPPEPPACGLALPTSREASRDTSVQDIISEKVNCAAKPGCRRAALRGFRGQAPESTSDRYRRNPQRQTRRERAAGR